MPYPVLRSFLLLLFLSLTVGCASYQPTKNVWKTTKSLWNSYVSPPASVNYEEKGDLPDEALALSTSMMGVDIELAKLERTMQNADKPPTQEWVRNLFSTFPWLSGFAGVKYDGQILGQEPAASLKDLDFIPLLYEDKRQNSRALRADVQPGPMGPEVMLATPLYDGTDFLGIVVAYFDLRSIMMRYSENANDIVVLCPTALLWPGKYDFAATPLAGVDWATVVRESTAGTCSNATGSFFYMVRYFGNLPMVFAIPQRGAFPEGNGSIEQGLAFFPGEREKLPPPPMPERKPRDEAASPAFVQPEPENEVQPEVADQQPQGQPVQRDPNELQPGSRDSMLLKRQQGSRRKIEERRLEGEDMEYMPPQRAPEQSREPALELVPESDDMPTLPGGRPSPFGPREETSAVPMLPGNRPSPFGPSQKPAQEQPLENPAQARTGGDDAAPAVDAQPAPEASAPEKPASGNGQPDRAAGKDQVQTSVSEPSETSSEDNDRQPREPATLPGGRPSPFGPGRR